MNALNKYKSKFSSLISFLMVLGLMAGCASVTDANVDEPQTENVISIENDQKTDSDSIWLNSNGDDMDPIIDKPDTGGTYHD
jgi:uncharacterized protein YceK